jgi:hypothetical protein
VFFRRLGVFPGTADITAVAAVTGRGADALDAVAGLVDASLVRMTEGPDGEPRVLLLQTIRDHALERLATAGETDDVQRRHATYYAALVDELAPLLRTPRAMDVADRLSLEHDNIRAALVWSLREGETGQVDAERRDPGIRICVALWWFWASHGQVAAGRRWYVRAAEAAADEDSARMARLLLGLSVWSVWHDDVSDQVVPPELLASIEMADRWSDHAVVAEARSTLAQWLQGRDDTRAAADQFELALRHADLSGDQAIRAEVLQYHAWLGWQLGDYDRARAMLEESLRIYTVAGNERDVLGRRRDLADLMYRSGDPVSAQAALAHIAPEVLRMREPAMIVEVMGTFAECALELGHTRRYLVLASACQKFHLEIGWPETGSVSWEEEMVSVRDRLGDEDWNAAREEGLAMTMSGALEWAVATAEAGSAPVPR